ncbi:nucleoside 2-deoxyribosyltransferase domain-containing protein [Nonomuraea jiangxiensis]|nr:nucleoside 2-deoxyribosyltransferase domain-containing protein [Nonomuraea jiangxiensis]
MTGPAAVNASAVPPATGCVFCAIVAGRAPASIVREWDDALAIRPLGGGVAEGHVLVVSRRHVADVGVDPLVSASVMARAAELAAGLPAANVITSRGSAATQTVYHLHLHVVPRVEGDGLPLPWTPRQAARDAGAVTKHWTLTVEPPATVRLVCAREPIPGGPSVFLAGPTPDDAAPVPSWRPEAIRELGRQWSGPEPLVVLCPESRGNVRAERYEDQVDWEIAARAGATAIMFWVPRDMATLPGMTTNVEFGLDVGTGRAVLGCPPGCPNPERNRYLIYVARRHGVPVRTTVAGTVTTALDVIAAQPA